jgi:hypothetical protein
MVFFVQHWRAHSLTAASSFMPKGLIDHGILGKKWSTTLIRFASRLTVQCPRWDLKPSFFLRHSVRHLFTGEYLPNILSFLF